MTNATASGSSIAPREKRLERVHRQRGWDEQEFARREESQMPLDEKRSRADYVIANDGDHGTLASQVRRILNEILGPAAHGSFG
jgi:dephospho-CoA kinase